MKYLPYRLLLLLPLVVVLTFLCGSLPVEARYAVWNDLVRPIYSGNPNNQVNYYPVNNIYTYPGYSICSGNSNVPLAKRCKWYPAGTAKGLPLSEVLDRDGSAHNDGSWSNSAGINFNVHAGDVHNQAKYQSGGRVCALIDPTTSASWTRDSYESPHDDVLVRWYDSYWKKDAADAIGNSYIDILTCSTDVLPANSLSASPIRIKKGESSTLSFDRGANALVQGTSCTTSNFTISTHTENEFYQVPRSYSCDLEGCWPSFEQKWVGRSSGIVVPDTAGSLTVSPTVTTTYTYSCTNGNGTTVRTATVTVGEELVPADVTLSANPTSITAPATSRLTWTSTNATSCSSANFTTGGATSGAVDVAPTTTTTYSVSCTGAGGSSAVKYATVTVANGAKPDLTSSTVSPSSATVGVPVTLSATISNSGAAATGGSFVSLFQRATSPSGDNATDIGTVTTENLAVGASAPSSFSYTFPSSGVWYVRACADKNSASGTGTVVESNENNNCSTAWTAVTVNTTPSGSLSCTASPTTFAPGGTARWTALPSGLGTYTFDPTEPGPNVVLGTNVYDRTYAAAGTYGMSVTAGGTTAACSTNVTVGAVCGTASPTLSASPARVVAGVGTSVLSLSASGVDSTCTLSGPGVSRTFTGASCSVAPTTVTTPVITGQSVYTLSCDGAEATAQTIVNVVPKVIEF